MGKYTLTVEQAKRASVFLRMTVCTHPDKPGVFIAAGETTNGAFGAEGTSIIEAVVNCVWAADQLAAHDCADHGHDREDATGASGEAPPVTRWAWSVEGTDIPSGTVERSMEDSGVVAVELAGEVLQWLATDGPFWDNLDTDHPFTIKVAPDGTVTARDVTVDERYLGIKPSD